MKSFKNMLVVLAIFAMSSVNARYDMPARHVDSNIPSTPIKSNMAERVSERGLSAKFIELKNKIINNYSSAAKENDRFTASLLESLNKSNLTDGEKKDLLEKAMSYYESLQNVIQENLDRLAGMSGMIAI